MKVLKELSTLARIEWNTEGFKGSDKLKALELLGKYHALFTDKQNVSGDFVHEVIRPTVSTIIIQGVKGDSKPE